jgi:flagellar hook-basal body complex protein FliE
MPDARREKTASAAAELAVMADTIERHRERVASLVTPFLGSDREDVVISIQEAERQLQIAARALRRALKSLER